MKKIFNLNKFFRFAAICFALGMMTSCSDSNDGPSGDSFSAIYELTSVSNVSVTDFGSGVNRIGMRLYNSNYSVDLAFATAEAELTATSFTYMPALSGAFDSNLINGGFAATLTALGRNVRLGSDTEIAITRSADNLYDITLTSTVNGKDHIKAHFAGEISFVPQEEIGQPSGYTVMISEGEVVDEAGTVHSGMTKYAIIVYDPDGNQAAEFDAVNKSGMTLVELAGSYPMTSYPTESWTMDNGWVIYYPGMFEMAGGSFYRDGSGTNRYITKGAVTISAVSDGNGGKLFSFSGEGLSTLTAQNEAAENGSFEIKCASEAKLGGEVLSDLTIKSQVLGMDMNYTVYLPDGWDGSKKYPVLYLLHGATGNNNDWIVQGSFGLQLSAAIAMGKGPKMVVVMPNCTVDGKDLFYCNGYQGDAQYMTYFFDEFVPEVESRFSIQSDRAHRMISGLSMGGYGSLYYGALHPEMFSYVYACSPATYIDGTPNIYELYGNDLANGLEIPGITIEIGTEDFLFQSADYFNGYLQGIGIPCEYITRSGSHDWKFWMACAPKIIAKAYELFR